MMPISDMEGYSEGHFSRVYEHIIRPACVIAELDPIRADDVMTTNYIALDIIKNIISCDMSICDLSGRNPNVLYELGVRQAFNLPVTLLKDQRTNRVFDIQGFRDVEYDESLRIDSVQETIETLSTILKNTYQNTSEINSLVSLLGIEPAKVTSKTKISSETELILNALSSLDKRINEFEKHIQPKVNLNYSKISSILSESENVGEILSRQDIEKLVAGDKVYHMNFGAGEITSINKMKGLPYTANIRFDSGEKRLLLEIAQLRKL